MNIFTFEDYRKFIRFWVGSQKERRGTLSRLSKAMGISTTMMSQILSETKKLSHEMADQMALAMGLTDKETEYLFLLVDLDRAGTHSLKTRLKKRIHLAAQEARSLENRIRKDQELSETARATYYSSWLYSGVRNLAAIPELAFVESMSAHLGVSTETLLRVVQFLIENELLKREGGRLEPLSKITHLPAKSPLVVKHHQNWRLRAFQKMDEYREKDFFFTGPMSLSKELAKDIRTELPTFIERLGARLGPSESEAGYCLNIDWFEF